MVFCARHIVALIALWAGARGAWAVQYTRTESYIGTDFFSRWRFFSGPDPTHGAVQYVDQETAVTEGLAKATADNVYLGADMTNVVAEGARHSVRIESTEVYNGGLFVLKVDHAPTGCGTWPAFWMFGEDAGHPWPVLGEYDIVEGVHGRQKVMTTLHTTPGCDQSLLATEEKVGESWNFGANQEATNCDVHAPGQFFNQGCSQNGPEGSLGEGFNARGGGTYAAEWDPVREHIRTWFWLAGTEPADLVSESGALDPDVWGRPYSYFSLAPTVCPTAHFQNMRLIFDLTFCGDLGNPTWTQSCPTEAASMSCQDFVATQPERFKEAFWSIRRLDAYQRASSPAPGATTSFMPGRPFSPSRPPDVYVTDQGSSGDEFFTVSVSVIALLSFALAIHSMGGPSAACGHLAEAAAPVVEQLPPGVRAAGGSAWEAGSRLADQMVSPEARIAAREAVVERWNQLQARVQAAAGAAWESATGCGRVLRERAEAAGYSPMLLSWLDEVGVVKGDLVTVRRPFIAAGSIVGSSTLSPDTNGVVKHVEQNGNAIIEFEGHLGRFRVSREEFSNLEVPREHRVGRVAALLAEQMPEATATLSRLLPHWRIIAGLLMAAILLLICIVNLSQESGGDGAPLGQPIRWANHPAKCLDSLDGVHVQIYDCSGAASQRFVQDIDGRVRWQPKPDLCMDVLDHKMVNGNSIQLSECRDWDEEQTWMCHASNQGAGKLRWERHPTLCADVTDHQTFNGNLLQLWTCMSTDTDQEFIVDWAK